MRVLLIDDQELVRYAIGTVLKAQGDVELVGAAATGAEALGLALAHKPAVVITETVTPGLSGIEAAAQILAQVPETRVLALTMRQEAQIVQQALMAQFRGYVLKKCAFSLLLEAIRAVAAGQMFLCPEVVGAAVAGTVRPAGVSGAEARISEREREVLQLVAEGYSTKETADRLEISLKTVETHRRRIMAKLKLFSVAQLTKYAIREGITSI